MDNSCSVSCFWKKAESNSGESQEHVQYPKRERGAVFPLSMTSPQPGVLGGRLWGIEGEWERSWCQPQDHLLLTNGSRWLYNRTQDGQLASQPGPSESRFPVSKAQRTSPFRPEEENNYQLSWELSDDHSTRQPQQTTLDYTQSKHPCNSSLNTA